jgi:serine/threonine-protein kinase SRPK3
MNGETTKAAINKAKQTAANAINGSANAQKKRRKGGDLKPIITTEQQREEDAKNQKPHGAFDLKNYR